MPVKKHSWSKIQAQIVAEKQLYQDKLCCFPWQHGIYRIYRYNNGAKNHNIGLKIAHYLHHHVR
jgi:hypothetical protein